MLLGKQQKDKRSGLIHPEPELVYGLTDSSCLCLVLSCLVFWPALSSRFPDTHHPTKMKFTFAALATATVHVHAHSRIACPPARNMNSFESTSIKYGPCGDDTGNFTANTIEISPGFFSPFVFCLCRLSLSQSLVFGLCPTRPPQII
jgi:hypothetical protein